MAELLVQNEKQRFAQAKQAVEHATELRENAALKEKAILQQKLHDQEIQRIEQVRVTERFTLTLALALTLTLKVGAADLDSGLVQGSL